MTTPRASRQRWRLNYLLPFIILGALLGVALFFSARIYITQNEQRSNQIAACERGNDLRERVGFLEALAADRLPADYKILTPFPCDSIR